MTKGLVLKIEWVCTVPLLIFRTPFHAWEISGDGRKYGYITDDTLRLIRWPLDERPPNSHLSNWIELRRRMTYPTGEVSRGHVITITPHGLIGKIKKQAWRLVDPLAMKQGVYVYLPYQIRRNKRHGNRT